MKGLTTREKRLLGLCLASVFLVANLFAGRAVMRSLGGGKGKISELKNELAENEMWLEESDLWDRRQVWLEKNLPDSLVRQRISAGNAQGELMQSLQNELLERKLKIEHQSLLEPVNAAFHDEVAVNLRIKGEAAVLSQWLATLQSPEKFQVIKDIKLKLDDRSKEAEPQAECDITIARWFAPSEGDHPAPEEETSPNAPEGEGEGGEKPPIEGDGKLELTERSS